MAAVIDASLFADAENFLNLLLKQAARANQVVVRSYGNGTWQQYSGKDFSAHLGRGVASWLKEFPLEQRNKSKQTIAFLCRPSYASLIAPFAATLAGLDVLLLPSHASTEVIEWCTKKLNILAFASDIDEVCPALSGLGLPVYNIGKTVWLPQDKHAEPALFKAYREYRTVADAREAGGGEVAPEFLAQLPQGIGQFKFISFGHDGFQKPETLKADALVLVAHNFLQAAAIPAQIHWKSLELMPPATPFAIVSRFAVLLKNGVIGFSNLTADWETNLRILRPTVLFASPKELEPVVQFIEELAAQPVYKGRIAMSATMDKANVFLQSSKVARYGDGLFSLAKKGLRVASRAVIGNEFVKEAVEDLAIVIHGLAPAHESVVGSFEKLDIPVLETFGTTSAGGILSTNTFEAPFFNLIGSPLSHVAFRLGNNSTLEYRLSSQLFENANKWQETGDVVQMTAHGFAIAGREKHLFVTAGGMTVSPVRLERLLKDNPVIGDVCIVGDRMPYLAALIVLSQEAATEFRLDASRIQEQVAEVVAKVNETLPRNVTIKKFQILEKPFQENLGEKLPNGDINRLKIQETRNSLIQSLYL